MTRRNLRLRAGAALAAAAVGATGCGFAIPSTKPISRAPVVFRLLVDIPKAQRSGVALALSEANKNRTGTLQDVTLEAVYLDPPPGPRDAAAERATIRKRVLDDSTVVGMVGPRDGVAARQELPLFNRLLFPVVSPSLTDECLTQQPAYCNNELFRLRPNSEKPGIELGLTTFYRVPPVRPLEASVAADFAFQKLDARDAVVVSDQTQAGTALATTFSNRWTNIGGRVVATVSVTGGVPAAAAANEAAGTAGRRHVDFVYVASGRVDVYRGVVKLLPRVPVIGTAAVLTADVARGVPAGGRAYATSPALDAPSAAPRFTRAWRAANPKAGAPPPFALEAYYATQSLVEAIRRAIVTPAPGTVLSPPTRGDILKQLPLAPLRTEDLYGLTFDDHGDNASGLVSVHEARAGAWQFSSQMQFAG